MVDNVCDACVLVVRELAREGGRRVRELERERERERR